MSGNSSIAMDLSDRVNRIMVDGKARNTSMAYEKAIRYFEAWLVVAHGIPLVYPVGDEVMLDFCLSHIEGLDADIEDKLIEMGVKARKGLHTVSSIRSKLIGIGHFHKEAGAMNPCKSDVIRDLLSSAERIRSKAGCVKRRSLPITKPILDRMIRKINVRTLEGLRDRALLEFAFYTGGRRRSEVANAEFRFLNSVKRGYEYYLHRSKTDQRGKGAIKLLRHPYAMHLESWIRSAGIVDGFLFRRIDHKGRVTEDRIQPNEINDNIVKRYISAIGEDHKKYSAHGIRRGFVTWCGRLGLPLFDVMQMTGHSDVKTVLVYYAEGKIDSNPATKL